MVTDLFGMLLQELGRSLQVNNLHSDRNNTCLIRLKGGTEIQLELDRSGQFIVIGADLGPIPIGRYRENLFREALKANDFTPPLNGILAYSQKSDHLILFERLNIKELNGEKIASLIPAFEEKASLWSKAIQNNEVPSISRAGAGSRLGGMFGLRP